MLGSLLARSFLFQKMAIKFVYSKNQKTLNKFELGSAFSLEKSRVGGHMLRCGAA